MTVEEFYNLGEISVRTLNVCRSNGLNNLQLILSYYLSKKNFMNLRNIFFIREKLNLRYYLNIN